MTFKELRQGLSRTKKILKDRHITFQSCRCEGKRYVFFDNYVIQELPGEKWKTYYVDSHSFTNEEVFENEAEACDYFYNWMRNTWRRH